VKQLNCRDLSRSRRVIYGAAALMVMLGHMGTRIEYVGWLRPLRILQKLGGGSVEIFLLLGAVGLYHSLGKGGRLRDFYLRYGDRADILWLRDHLSNYIFLGEEAEKLHKAITSIRIPAGSIRSLMDELDQYMVYRDSFYELFEDNYFLAAMNISTSDQPTGIISQDGQSFFVYSFWGRPAPAGLGMDLEDMAAF